MSEISETMRCRQNARFSNKDTETSVKIIDPITIYHQSNLKR